jgi:hypothetical protein
MSDDRVPLNDGDAIGLLYETLEENDRLRARVLALEAEVAVMRGTLARHGAPDDQPMIIHDVPGNAPR